MFFNLRNSKTETRKKPQCTQKQNGKTEKESVNGKIRRNSPIQRRIKVRK